MFGFIKIFTNLFKGFPFWFMNTDDEQEWSPPIDNPTFQKDNDWFIKE